jgi:uncharacterized protein involved in exopolysaccharide biosynthesis
VSELQTTTLASEDEMDLQTVVKTLWAGKLLITICTVVVAAGFFAYALLATPMYSSQASVQVRDEKRAGLTSELGGLAALAGISVGTQNQSKELALASLKSRVVIQRMIEEENLLQILYAHEWDATNKRWRVPNPPTPWKAYDLFTKKILKVSEDRKSGILTVSVEWSDPALAAAWVKALIARVNNFVNDATIREAELNLKFLDDQGKNTSVVELQKTIFAMMESEIKRLMLARNPETAPLRIIDPPLVSERRVSPQRGLILALGIFAGGLLGVFIVWARSAIRA